MELFALREKDVPIDIYEGFGEKEVIGIEWEPSENRFAAIKVLGPMKSEITFFQMEKQTLKELRKFINVFKL